ncbi:hypothetical protein [Methylocystis sp. JR02]|uniref:hypothetical protein n=1 Tax=Methylocystis sp. JR02 TaxID=3046284 RepID=UPI0024BB751E|nr:hypothetical protein [Methylocystis sp. JR02]MDJ0447181.1 hypothetical protein [Methylocystis sp. JR02]
MRIASLFAVLALGAALGACESTTPAEQRAMDDARCKSYGFKRGTDGYSKCLLDVDLDRSADRRERRMELSTYPRFYGGFGGPYWRYW